MSSLAERIGSWSTPALPPFLFLHAFFRGAACVPFFALSALLLPLRLPPFLSLPLPPPPPEPSSGKETELPPCLLPPVSGLSRPTATPSVAPSMSPSTPIFNISHICTAYRRPFPSSPPSSSPPEKPAERLHARPRQVLLDRDASRPFLDPCLLLPPDRFPSHLPVPLGGGRDGADRELHPLGRRLEEGQRRGGEAR